MVKCVCMCILLFVCMQSTGCITPQFITTVCAYVYSIYNRESVFYTVYALIS